MLEKLEKAVSLNPSNCYDIHELGAAQYRVGAYEEALATFARAEKIKDANIERFRDPSPTIDGFTAMALHQLGRNKEANAVIQLLRGGLKEEWFTKWDRFMLNRVVEVEKLFAGEDSTLLSIWELIEEDKLDEASDLIEKARESKNANYVSPMEGAIKLLEVLRKRKQ